MSHKSSEHYWFTVLTKTLNKIYVFQQFWAKLSGFLAVLNPIVSLCKARVGMRTSHLHITSLLTPTKGAHPDLGLSPVLASVSPVFASVSPCSISTIELYPIPFFPKEY